MSKKKITLVSLGLLACVGIGVSVGFAAKPARRQVRVSARRGSSAAPIVKKFGPEIFHEVVAEQRQTHLTTDIGVQVAPHPNAVGAELDLHREISKAFTQQAPLPAQRVGHFQWMTNPTLHLRGWSGSIQKVLAAPDGFVLKVAIRPHLVSEASPSVFTQDYYLETYEYNQGRLRFVSGEDPADAKRTIITD